MVCHHSSVRRRNGRIARADGTAQRYYNMSSQIRVERDAYYRELENAQKGNLDITSWLCWFLKCLHGGLASSSEVVGRVMGKHRFCLENRAKINNERQRAMLNRLLDGFEGKLTAVKWGKMMKCSPDTALRDINGLIAKGILEKGAAGGRSTGYTLRAG